MLSTSHRFEIILVPAAKDEPISLGSATDPDLATVTFHQELQRLKQERIEGELVLLCHDDARSAVLRQPLA